MAIQVKVAQVGRLTQELTLNGDHSVQAALTIAKVKPEGFAISVNSRPAGTDTALKNGDMVLMSPEVKGGSF